MENIINPTNQSANIPENISQPVSSSKTNPLILVSLILFILLIATGAFALGKYSSLFQPQPEITQIIKPNKIATPSVDSIENWKIYQNKEFKYEVKYPPEITFIEEKSDIFIFQTNFLKKQTGYLNGFIITITKNDGLEDALTYWRWRVVGHISSKIDKETTLKVNNIEAVKLDYTSLNDNQKYSFIIIPKDSYNYVIQSSSDQITQILSTFRFLDDTTTTVTPQTTNTENWKTYKNSKYQYSFKYPSDWSNFSMKDFSKTNLIGDEESLYIGPLNSNTKPPQILQITTYPLNNYHETELYSPQSCTVENIIIGINKINATMRKCKDQNINSSIVLKTNNYAYIIDELNGNSTLKKTVDQILSTFKFLE